MAKPELINTTRTLLNEISMLGMKRMDIARTYGLAILSSEETDWATVNSAIIARRSRSGLDYVKQEAWRYIEKDPIDCIGKSQ
jgi:hypothetical protein